MLIEFGYGWANGSLGMLSDAAHMLLDNAAIAIGLAAAHIAAKQTSAEGRLYADR
jgi:cobalt-zinc-cadmium efflux system protein